MALRVHCPSCLLAYSLPDGLEGKKVVCKECQYRFVVRTRTADEFVEAEPDEALPADEPPRPSRPASRREEGLQDRPGRVRPAPRDVNEDDRPVRRRPKAPPPRRSNAPVWIAAGAGALVLGLAGAGLGAWLLWPSPEQTPAGPIAAAPPGPN